MDAYTTLIYALSLWRCENVCVCVCTCICGSLFFPFFSFYMLLRHVEPWPRKKRKQSTTRAGYSVVQSSSFLLQPLLANGLSSFFLVSSPKQNSILHHCMGPQGYAIAVECSLVSLTVNTRYILQCTERLMSSERVVGKHIYRGTYTVKILFVGNLGTEFM